MGKRPSVPQRQPLQEAEQRKLESAKARALQEAEELLGRLADVIPMLDSGLTPKDLLDQKYLSKDGQPNDSAVSMVTNMNQFLQQEIDRLSDENAQMDEQLAAVGASPVGDYMANAGVVAEDAKTERCGDRCTGINGRGRTSGNRNAGRIG